MNTNETMIHVFANWKGFETPVQIGILFVNHLRGKTTTNFEFTPEWLQLKFPFQLDPDLFRVSGRQFPAEKDFFGIFYDSMPDSWGRTLIKLRNNLLANDLESKKQSVNELDFLIAVDDVTRMGAIRLKTDLSGEFIARSSFHQIPPINSLREIQHAIEIIEKKDVNTELRKWVEILILPGSSLGGARPKSNVYDEHGSLWIAKFPSGVDEIDKAAWEYLVYSLAIKCGIEMSPSQLLKVKGRHHIFLTKRFDREKVTRIHFASAMTMIGKTEEHLKDSKPSYLEIAEFLQHFTANPKQELEQLWRRMIFNIAVSNTDDHLRNHGFLLQKNGWTLSPAFDINSSVDRDYLSLNINLHDGDLSFELAKSVGIYFQLNTKQMNKIIDEVKVAISDWRVVAAKLGISRSEQDYMSAAFEHD